MTELVEFLTSKEAWLTLHPPLDFALKSIVNQAAVNFAENSEPIIQLHKTLSALFVATGLALIGVGLANHVSKLAASVFVALATASVAVVYAAHHAIGESPTVFLVGLGVYLVLRGPWGTAIGTVTAAIPIAVAGLFRPEAALIFSSLAVLPLIQRNWRRALLFVVVAAGPTLALTLATELFTNGVTYATVRPFGFGGSSVWQFLIDQRVSQLVWGLGIGPWLGLAIVIGLSAFALLSRSHNKWLIPALTLSLLWLFWGFGFVLLLAIGVIPQVERVFVFPALFGAVALAILSDAATLRGYRTKALGVSVAVVFLASGLLVWRGLAQLPERYDTWEQRLPGQVKEVSTYLTVNSNPDRSVLFDWMWWWEWPAGVHASLPGLPGGVCNYLLCSEGVGSGAPDELTNGLGPIEIARLDAAWRFMAASTPEHIVKLTDIAYEEWLTYQTGNPVKLSSFVRPLLRSNGECFITHDDLGQDRYCPVLANARYILLERQG